MEKFIGDAVMAVFGAPLAHEDDAERAIRAGLRILEAIAEANADDPALDLKVRIGINTGEAVVSLGRAARAGRGVRDRRRREHGLPTAGRRARERDRGRRSDPRGDGVDLRVRGTGARRAEGQGRAGAAVVGEGGTVAVRHRRHARAHDAARRPGARTRPAHRDVRARRPRPIGAPRHRRRRARASASRGWSRSSSPTPTVRPISSRGGRAGACPTARASRSGPWARS